jgi:hypothetical protein
MTQPLDQFYRTQRSNGYVYYKSVCKTCERERSWELYHNGGKSDGYRFNRHGAEKAHEERERQQLRHAMRTRTAEIIRKPVSRRHVKCTDCHNYPCFQGIDGMVSNLAETCHGFTRKKAAQRRGAEDTLSSA